MNIHISEDAMGQLESLLSEFGSKICSATTETRIRLLKSVMSLVTLRNERFIGPICSAFLEACVPSSGVIKRERLNSNSPRLSEHARHQSLESFFRVLGTCSMVSQSLVLNHCQSKMRRLPKDFVQSNYASILERFVEKLCATDRDMYGTIGLRALLGLLMHDGNPAYHMQLMDRDVAWKISDILKIFLSEADQYDLKASRQSVSSFLHSFNKLKEISEDVGLEGLESEKKARITKECDRLYNSILKRLVSCGVQIDSEDQKWRCDSTSMAAAAVVSFIVSSVSEEDLEKCVGMILPVLHQVSLLSTEHWSKVSSAIWSIFVKNQREDSKIALARVLWRQSRDRADVIRWEELFIRVNCTFPDQLFKALLSAVLHFRSVVLYNFLVKRSLESNLEQYDNKARLACFVKCSKMLLKVISSSAVLTMCSLLRDTLWSVPGERSLEYFYRIFLPILQNVKVNRQFVQFGVELSEMWTDKRNFDPAHSCKLLMVIESLDVCIQRIPRSTIARGIEGAFSGLKKDLVLGCRSIISCKREFPLRKQLVCAAFRLHCHVFDRWPEKGGSRLASALSAPCILKTCSLFEWNWQFDEENKANLPVENSSNSVDSDEAFFDFTLPRQPLRGEEEREITVIEGGGFQYLKSAADVAVKMIDSYYEDGQHQQLSSWTDSLVEILSEKQKSKCAQLFVIYALTTSKKRVLLNSEQTSALWKCLHRNADLELSSSFVKVLVRLVDSKILRTEYLEQMCTNVIERCKKSQMTALGKSEDLLRKILADSTLSEKFMESTVNGLLQYAVSESISEDARVIALEVLRVLLSGSRERKGVLFECVPPQRLLELYSTVKKKKLHPLLLNIVGYAIGEQKLSMEDVLQVTGTVEFPTPIEVHIYLSYGASSCLLRHLDQILAIPEWLKRKDVMEILERLIGQDLIENTEVVLNEILGLRQFEDPDAYVRLIVALLSRTNSVDEVKFKSWIEENMANQQLMGNLCSRLETVISDDLSKRVSSKVVLLFLLVLCESDKEDVKCSLLSLLRKVVEKLSLDEMEIYSGICDIDGVPLTRKALLILEARRIIEGNEIIHKMECTVVEESIQLSCLTDTQLTQSSLAHSVTESIISVESISDTIRIEEWEDLEDDQEEEKERNDRKERKESSRADVIIDLLRTNSPTAILIAATVLESEGLLKKCKKFHNFDEMIFFLKNRRISAEFPWNVLLDEGCRSGRMSEVVEAVKHLDCGLRPLNVDVDYHRKRLSFVAGLVSADVQTEIMGKWKGDLNLWISEFESLSSPFEKQIMVRSLRVYLDDLLIKSPGTFYPEFHPLWKSACSQLINKYNRDEIVLQLGPHFFLWFCDPQNEDSSLRSAYEFWLRWKELLMKAVQSSAASSAWKQDVSFLTYSRFLFIDGNVTTFLREKLSLVRDEVLQKYVICVLKSRLWLTSQSVDEVETNAELVRKLMESL